MPENIANFAHSVALAWAVVLGPFGLLSAAWLLWTFLRSPRR